MTESIVVDRTDPACVVVTLNRPEKRNALSLALWRELASIFAALEDDEHARVVILTGAGGYFCAGADISEFAEVRTGKAAGEIYEAAVEQCNVSIQTLSKPTIAAISGFCIGGGFALAQVCDFRVADTTAVFAVPPARLGIVYSRHECETLLALVGLAKAKEILFTAEQFGIEQATAYGVVDRVADDGTNVLATAREFAARITGNAPLSLKGMKLILNALAAGAADDKRGEIKAHINAAIESDDYKEAVRSFADKRQPQFRGH